MKNDMTDHRQSAIHQSANLGRSCTHAPKASLTALQWVSTPFFSIVVLPIFILAAAIALEYSGLDLRWEALFFDASSKAWIFKDHWLFDHILHGGGYAFLSLYFLLHLLDPPRKKYGLIAGLILGGIYGVGQQFRGAHFPSHDLFTAVICWYASCFFYYLYYPKQWRSLIHD